MILYANGDSHTYGFSVNPGSPNFVNILAKQINYKEVNHATPGASNDKILRTTLDWLKNNTPDFVVIGWATWEREEWVIDNKYLGPCMKGFINYIKIFPPKKYPIYFLMHLKISSA